MLSSKRAKKHPNRSSLIRKCARARKAAGKENPHIEKKYGKFDISPRERREKKLKKLGIYKQPPNRWFNKLGPCDTWTKTKDGNIYSPHKPKFRKNNRDGAELVSNKVNEPKDNVFKYHKLGFYQSNNLLTEKLVVKLKPAYNKACRYFRPYIPCDKFAFAIRCCVHYGFTTKRIKALLRIGDILRRGCKAKAIKHLRSWICANFSAEKRKRVIMDFNESMFEDDRVNDQFFPPPNDELWSDSDSSSEEDDTEQLLRAFGVWRDNRGRR